MAHANPRKAARLLKDPTLLTVMSGAIFALSGLLGFAIRLILKGELVARKHLDDANAQAAKWQEAWRLSQEAHVERDRRSEASTEALGLVAQFMEAIERGRAQ